MAVTILPFVQEVLIRYVMSTYLAMGVMGNLCNCMIFRQKSYRRIPCSTYLLALSVFAIIYLIWSVSPLLYTLDHFVPESQSLVYCKMRLYGSHVLGQFVRSLVVFACADRFFMTQTSVRIRSWSSIKIARKLIIIMIPVWLIAGFHLPIFMDIRNDVCGLYDFYKLFYAIYQLTLVGILPPLLMSIFSFLTIYSLHHMHGDQTHIRRKDRDLMRMLIAEIIVNIFTSIPFSANLVYGAATYYVVDKSIQRLEIESFITFFSQFLIHILSVAPFYLFIIASKSFRHEFICTIIKWWHKYIPRQVRVVPLNI